MCDCSLMRVNNHMAQEGEDLVTHRFEPTRSLRYLLSARCQAESQQGQRKAAGSGV